MSRVMFLALGVLLLGRTVAADVFPSGAAWQVVTVEGRALPQSLRAKPALTLLRSTGGALAPIPFQIDERAPDGELALPYGPRPTYDDTPGQFDDDDLLVFLAADAGARALVADAVEIEVTDPAGGARGWVYLRAADRDGVPPRDDVDYLPAADLVQARHYSLQFGPHTPIAFTFADGKGHAARNVLDRVKARVSAGVLFGLLRFHKDEQDLQSTVLAWTDGPVRVVRRAELAMHLGYGLPDMTFTAETVLSADTFEGPVLVRLPFDLRYVFGDLDVRIFLDFDGLDGYRVFSNGLAPVPIACGATADPAPAVETTWFGMTGPEGTFIHALRFSSALGTVHRRLHVVSGADPDPPERVPGNCPGVGYTLTDWGGVGRGTHQIGMVIRAFPQYEPGDERPFLASLDQPLAVAVHGNEIGPRGTDAAGDLSASPKFLAPVTHP